MTTTTSGNSVGKRTKDRTRDRERATAALDLRRDGLTWIDIAERLDYHDASAAYTAVSRVLARVESEGARKYREITSLRYERLYADALEALDAIGPGREVGRAALLSAARGILDAMCRLHGLSAGVVSAPVVKVRDDVADELARLTAAMQAAGKETTQ